jgi:CRISPR-associated endoribonuclease Cas6
MPEPILSTVIHLKALERGSIPQYMGAAVRSEFLSLMGVSESEEAEVDEQDEMHNGNQLRPYTVSDLRGTFHAQKGFNLVEPGQSAWFRVTTLRKEQTDRLCSVLPDLPGKVVEMGRVRFQVENISRAGKHPWAGETSYESLVDRYLHSLPVPSDALEIRFGSLTTFHAGDLHMPLPIPENVLGSWLKRWNHFSAASLPRAVKELHEAKLVLSQYKIESTSIAYRGTLIGFTGTCLFRILSRDEFWVRLCNLLAGYSFYCGTGYKTAYGMGQTRRME